jgi:hypothetical protein
LIYDLKGIASQIDSVEIYKHFLININPTLNNFFKTVFTNHIGNIMVIKQTLKLIKTLL